MVLGTAAWNGVNFAVGLYLVLAVGGFVGLFVGLFAAFSSKRPLAWITCVSAGAIAALSAILTFGFLFDPARGVPLSSEILIGSFHPPIIFLYGAAFVCCSIEAALYFPKTRRMQLQ
jgi:ABC-type branched-subunit amino acid transport system permease subunit